MKFSRTVLPAAARFCLARRSFHCGCAGDATPLGRHLFSEDGPVSVKAGVVQPEMTGSGRFPGWAYVGTCEFSVRERVRFGVSICPGLPDGHGPGNSKKRTPFPGSSVIHGTAAGARNTQGRVLIQRFTYQTPMQEKRTIALLVGVFFIAVIGESLYSHQYREPRRGLSDQYHG